MRHGDKERIEVLIPWRISPGKRVVKAIKLTGHVKNDKNYNIKPLKYPKVQHFFEKHCMVTCRLAKISKMRHGDKDRIKFLITMANFTRKTCGKIYKINRAC